LNERLINQPDRGKGGNSRGFESGEVSGGFESGAVSGDFESWNMLVAGRGIPTANHGTK
jgi:hypothetical protein